MGATLWVATPEVLAQADRLADIIEEAGVTAIDTVPTLLSMLGRDVPGLRIVILGGEALPASLMERWARRAGGCSTLMVPPRRRSSPPRGR